MCGNVLLCTLLSNLCLIHLYFVISFLAEQDAESWSVKVKVLLIIFIYNNHIEVVPLNLQRNIQKEKRNYNSRI